MAQAHHTQTLEMPPGVMCRDFVAIKRFMMRTSPSNFALRNKETGQYLEYRIEPSDGQGVVIYFVKAKQARGFEYLGHIYRRGNYSQGQKSRFSPASDYAIVFESFYLYICEDRIHPAFDFYADTTQVR